MPGACNQVRQKRKAQDFSEHQPVRSDEGEPCCISCTQKSVLSHGNKSAVSLYPLLQVAVLVLAALGKFTLWGAVLVDVGTSLVVILHGMLLMRWRLPGAKRSATQSNKGQAGACASKQCCSSTMAAEHLEHRAAAAITGKPLCCSSSKQVQEQKDPLPIHDCIEDAASTK